MRDNIIQNGVIRVHAVGNDLTKDAVDWNSKIANYQFFGDLESLFDSVNDIYYGFW